MARLTHAEAGAVGAIALLLIVCASAVALLYQVRLSSLEELAEREATLSRLQAASRSAAGPGQQLQRPKASAHAFLDASTHGLAGAQLQTYVARVASDQKAILVSSGVAAPARDDRPDTIRMEASLDVTFRELQAILYNLESGTPYVFVESLTIRPSSAQRNIEDPLLRVTLNLRALLRRRSS
jgi:hypothetical protein